MVTVALYSPVRRFAFVNFDDPEYVTRNIHVRGGVTPQGLEWALTSGEAANWFPVTRLSHLLDSQLFDMRSGLHHLTSVWWHALAAVLLFAFLKRATHARWPSAWVAFLFALHPLHVESVAWVAERKDVLCAFFWFLALWAYVRYAERPGRGRYLAALVCFALGLMSKPMIVTLPFLLLVLDAWPLRRLSRAAVIEKIPFFLLSAVSATVTYLVQQSSGAVKEIVRLPIGLRMENALVSCVLYCFKTIWPSGLAAFYPYPAGFAWWMVAAAGLTLAAVTVLALRSFRGAPYLAAGWLWFLVTLGPSNRPGASGRSGEGRPVHVCSDGRLDDDAGLGCGRPGTALAGDCASHRRCGCCDMSGCGGCFRGANRTLEKQRNAVPACARCDYG